MSKTNVPNSSTDGLGANRSGISIPNQTAGGLTSPVQQGVTEMDESVRFYKAPANPPQSNAFPGCPPIKHGN